MGRTHWQDWIVLGTGLMLALVPLLWEIEAPEGLPRWTLTAVFGAAGLLAALAAALALYTDAVWEEWIALVAGAWLAAAPWVLGFSGDTLLTWLSAGAGAVIFVMAVLSLTETGR
ncbi:SPW repeat protein [Acidimangrovimonas sediminis]|uniref:SPW repeat protein n=1 Tax=Acidimangrovimonas sediminis TaxID=2056283 RepID=UPI000C8071FB|nr:SPW repeat protein [Acidimangrovimonas sediminis]